MAKFVGIATQRDTHLHASSVSPICPLASDNRGYPLGPCGPALRDKFNAPEL